MNKLEIKDIVQIAIVCGAALITWGALTTKVSALEEKIKPVPQLIIDTELVKSAVVDIKDSLRDIQRELRRSSSRREGL